MHQAEIIVLLLGLVAALVVVARKLALPYPVLLVIGGLAVSFIPHLPGVKLNPEVVFFFFLPPLIYPAALFTSWRDFRSNLRPILLLAIGLVLTTMVTVAWVAHTFVPAIPWAAAFALGAIVSPPDAIAATSVIRRLSVPHRIEAILEGESLVNDATALVALQFAIAALMSGSFSISHAAIRFVLVASRRHRRWIARRFHHARGATPPRRSAGADHALVAHAFPRLSAGGAAACLRRARDGRRRHLSRLAFAAHCQSSLTASKSFAFWEIVVFLLNGFVFIAIGLQLPGILRALQGESLVVLIDDALLVCAAAVLVRIGWVFTATYLPRLLIKKVRARDPYPGWRQCRRGGVGRHARGCFARGRIRSAVYVE